LNKCSTNSSIDGSTAAVVAVALAAVIAVAVMAALAIVVAAAALVNCDPQQCYSVIAFLTPEIDSDY
jgi:hypothetical protein